MNCSVENAEKPLVKTEAEEVFRRPEYRTSKEADAYRVDVSMPGVAKSGVEVRAEDGVLTVVGRRGDRVPEAWRALRVELAKPNYRLKLQLGDDVDAEGIQAAVDAGVLTLTLPVRAAVKARSIPVE